MTFNLCACVRGHTPPMEIPVLFVFMDNSGTDTIADFDVADAFELINLASVTTITDFNDLVTDHLSANAQGYAVISYDANSITLDNVAMSSLTADEFAFL